MTLPTQFSGNNLSPSHLGRPLSQALADAAAAFAAGGTIEVTYAESTMDFRLVDIPAGTDLLRCWKIRPLTGQRGRVFVGVDNWRRPEDPVGIGGATVTVFVRQTPDPEDPELVLAVPNVDPVVAVLTVPPNATLVQEVPSLFHAGETSAEELGEIEIAVRGSISNRTRVWFRIGVPVLITPVFEIIGGAEWPR